MSVDVPVGPRNDRHAFGQRYQSNQRCQWLVAVESRRGALVEGGGISGFRRLSPQCRCLSLHLDHVSSPRSSNPACGFPALGSHSRSCSRPRQAAPATFRRSYRNRKAGARQAHVFPDSASSLRPSHRRGRCAAHARASPPPLRGGPGPASLPHETPSGVSEPKSGLVGSRQSPSFLRPSRAKAPSLRRHYPASSVLRASPPPCRPKLALLCWKCAGERDGRVASTPLRVHVVAITPAEATGASFTKSLGIPGRW